MAIKTFGSLTFDPDTLAADLLTISADADFEPLSAAVIADANRRTQRADALVRSELAVRDFIAAGGSPATVEKAAQNLIGLAQNLAAAPETTPATTTEATA